MKIPEELKDIIISDPERMSGVPCFVGTRVPVYMLLDHLESGISLDEFLEDYPTVGKENALQVLAFAVNEFRERYGLEHPTIGPNARKE